MDIPNFDIKSLPSSSMNLIVSKRRAGKSYLTEHLIEEMKKENRVDVVLLFSGTGAGFENICEDCRFNDISKLVDVVNNYKKMNDFNKLHKSKRGKYKIKTTVIIDDLAGELKSKNYKILNNLATNGRHYAYSPLSLDFFILVQGITMIPRTMRLNADTISFTQIPSHKEFNLLTDECLYLTCTDRESKRLALDYYHSIVSEPYAFMCCELYRNNIVYMTDYLKRLKAP